MNKSIGKFWNKFNKEKHIAPLAVLRAAFGFIMLVSVIRFIAKGWVYGFYVKPKLHFPFYPFEWLKVLPATGIYIVFGIMLIATLFVMLGLFYRVSITAFFLTFLYVELIDKTYYLNHYYFVSLFAFLLILVPANRYFSLDVLRKHSLIRTHVPGWTINIFKFQLFIVYFFAGLSKITHEWLIQAMPLRIWLSADGRIPFIGNIISQTWFAYVASWFGALFDLSIGFLLLYKPTRKFGYLLVIIFHLFTDWLFKIGMFPYIMIFVTIIFFSENIHIKFIHFLRKMFLRKSAQTKEAYSQFEYAATCKKILYPLLFIYSIIQILLPLRFLLYSGKLFWTEEGYRFSWRVMLMEKAGTTYFHIQDRKTKAKGEVINSEFLTPLQERMMETQPDMILQYAHYLHDVYEQRGMNDPIVTVESYVNLNGTGSRLYIDSTVDLSREKESFSKKTWILPYNKN